MAWVAVDKNGTEKIFETIPVRREEVERATFGTLRGIIRKAYSKNNYKSGLQCGAVIQLTHFQKVLLNYLKVL